jgi:hypothetical protein
MIMQHLTLGYVMDFLFVVVLALMKAMQWRIQDSKPVGPASRS